MKTYSKWIAPLTISAALICGLSSCGKSGTGSSGEGKDGSKKIAVVISTLNNPWFVVLGESAQERAAELGYEASIFDSKNDTATEASHFENIIAAGYEAILLNPTDADGSIINVKKAKQAGLPVFCIDREINSADAATCQILSDNYQGCVDLAQYFVKVVGEEGKYIEILGLQGDNNTWNRSQGFHSVVDRYPGLERVAHEHADFDRSKALEVMETMLQTHGDIDAVFCGNDAMAMGVYQALVSAGKDKDVRVFGFDGAADVVDAVREGKIQATAMQYPKTMARNAAEYADAYLQGKRDFEQKIPVKVDLVSPETISKFEAYGKKEG